MDTNTAILLSILIPSLAVGTNLMFRNNPNLRDGLTLAAAVLTFLCVLNILYNEGNGTTEHLRLFTVLPGLDIAFNVEPLGLLFALVASGLWILTHLYGIGYMRGNNEKHHARFFASFSFAIASVMGIAFSANMFTLFLFYEALTISTYPLVAHKGTAEAIRGARTYLGILGHLDCAATGGRGLDLRDRRNAGFHPWRHSGRPRFWPVGGGFDGALRLRDR